MVPKILAIRTILGLLCAAPFSAFAATGWLQQFQGTLFLGANAPQVTISDSSTKHVSDGYSGHVLGAGISYVPRPIFALEADGFYAYRKFAFGETKGEFNTLQFPITAQARFWRMNIGAGMYAALWKYDGKITRSGASVQASATSAGHAKMETGFVALGSFKKSVYGLPLRFEVRHCRSMSDLAASASFKGSIVEWQMLVGLDIGGGGNYGSSSRN